MRLQVLSERNRLWGRLESEIQRRSSNKDEYFKLDGPWKRFHKETDGYHVYIVDGEWVRTNLTVLFGHGGHGIVHECIPMDEIWIADKHYKGCGCDKSSGTAVSPEYIESCLRHELYEIPKMKDGKRYLPSHRSALGFEKRLGLLHSGNNDKPKIKLKDFQSAPK